MNIFLVDVTENKLPFLDKINVISNYLKAVKEDYSICLLTPYPYKEDERYMKANQVFPTLVRAHSHFLKRVTDSCGDISLDCFSRLCERTSGTVETIRSGSLSRYSSLILAADSDILKSVLQNAFYMNIEEAYKMDFMPDGVRLLNAFSGSFFDLGYISMTDKDSLSGGAKHNEPQIDFETEEVVEKKHIMTYYESITQETIATFVKNINEKINIISRIVEQNRILWGDVDLNLNNSYLVHNDLDLFCLLMMDALRDISERSLDAPNKRQQGNSEEHTQENKEQLFGIDMPNEKTDKSAHENNNIQNSK